MKRVSARDRLLCTVKTGGCGGCEGAVAQTKGSTWRVERDRVPDQFGHVNGYKIWLLPADVCLFTCAYNQVCVAVKRTDKTTGTSTWVTKSWDKRYRGLSWTKVFKFTDPATVPLENFCKENIDHLPHFDAPPRVADEPEDDYLDRLLAMAKS